MVGKLRTILLVACSGALVVSAAGCVGNADPVDPAASSPTPTTSAVSSPPTASPSPTAKPTPTPVPASSNGPAKNWPVPKMPEAAKEKSEEGIRAFTEHYFETIEYTMNTNDTQPIMKLTDRDCTACFDEFIYPFDGNRVAGSWLVGAKFNPVITRAVVDGNGGVALFTVTQDEMTAYMSDGTVYGVFPPVKDPNPGTAVLDFKNGWKFISLDVKAE